MVLLIADHDIGNLSDVYIHMTKYQNPYPIINAMITEKTFFIIYQKFSSSGGN
jgi:hypothetical protein